MKKNFLLSLFALLALWGAWLTVSAVVKNDYILPSFSRTVSAAWELMGQADFWTAFSQTLLRTLLAFVLSVPLGVGLALLSALNGGVRAFLAPFVSILRTVPTMAVVLILLLWAGHTAAPVIVAMLVLFPAVYAAALAAYDGVTAQFGMLTRAYGVGTGQKIWRMYLPLSASVLLPQAGSVASLGLKITISGEVLANTYRSLGGMMQDAKMYLEMPRLLALTIVSLLLGFALEGLCVLIARLVMRGKA